jgi:hypothetical protein
MTLPLHDCVTMGSRARRPTQLCVIVALLPPCHNDSLRRGFPALQAFAFTFG